MKDKSKDTVREAGAEYVSESPAQTHAIGRALGESLHAGDVIALIGQLGAGKTCLVRGVAEGAGADPQQVSSPTFVLIQEYEGRIPLYHFDAYRLQGPGDMDDLGAEEYFSDGGACLVEWAERVEASLPSEHLRLVFEIIDEHTRRIRFEAQGERYRSLVEDVKRALKPVIPRAQR